VEVSTPGDRSSAPVAELGVGVFVSALRDALAAGEVDVAVHSYKDLPTATDPRLALAAVPQREDPRDALVARDGLVLGELPNGSRVGTGSARRKAQLDALGLGLDVVAIRGNVDTRLRKRREQELDAVVLAACGLDRIGLAAEIGFRLPVALAIPESGQGTIALQTRHDEVELVTAIDHALTHEALRGERACTRGLAGGCTVPVAAHATLIEAGRWKVVGYLGAVDGHVAYTEAREHADPVAAGEAVAAALLARGAYLLEDARA
jgi:hydroxymethylbilane synthase